MLTRSTNLNRFRLNILWLDELQSYLLYMKICSKCKFPKDDFCKDRKSKDGLQSVCKECKSTQIKRYYALHPEKRQRKRKQKLIRHQTRKMLLESAGGKCVLCGYNKSISALDFHHKEPEQKLFGIAVGLKSGYSYKRLLEETKKCVLVCSNCHHEVHDGLIKI